MTREGREKVVDTTASLSTFCEEVKKDITLEIERHETQIILILANAKVLHIFSEKI